MGIAIKPSFVVVFLMLLSLSVSFGLPAEDILDAVYDESKNLPYEGSPLFSIVASPVANRRPQAPPSSLHPRLGAPSLFAPTRVSDTDAERITDTRISLALLCTLLC
jgi:hypothetical protein